MSIQAKLGLLLIRNQLEKQTGLTAKNFDIVYVKEKNSIEFKIFGDKKIDVIEYADDKKLSDIISSQIKQKLHEDCEIDAFALKIRDKTIVCDVYYQYEKLGEKVKEYDTIKI